MDKEDLKTDSAILSFIIHAMIPYSKNKEFISLDKIMESNTIRNLGINKNDIIRLMTEDACCHIFLHQHHNGYMESIIHGLQ